MCNVDSIVSDCHRVLPYVILGGILGLLPGSTALCPHSLGPMVLSEQIHQTMIPSEKSQ
jgi:hypothetical protein